MSWLLLLTAYLWIAGGLGWIDAYEVRDETTMAVRDKALVLAVWPAMTLLSLFFTAKDELAAAWTGAVEDEGGEEAM